jgi:alpha-glucosidase
VNHAAEGGNGTERRALDVSLFVALGDVVFWERTAHGVVAGVGEEKFRVDVIRSDLLRLKISQAGHFDDSPTFAASFAMPDAPAFEVAEEEATLALQTEDLRLVIHKRPFRLSAHRRDGSLIFADAAEDGKAAGYRCLNDSFVVTRQIGLHDAIYGLGEKTGRFDRRGRRFVMWNTDVLAPDVLRKNRLSEADWSLKGQSPSFDPYYTSIPFFYHCQAEAAEAKLAGFFVDNGYKGNFVFDGRSTYSYAFFGGQYTEYIFAGPSMRSVLAGYTHITGRMRVPPMWALGQHQCRFHDYTQDDVLDVGRSYRERRIPCDVLWLDIGYMDGYRVFTWDREKFPDVRDMIARMTADKFRLVTIVDPGVKAEAGYAVFDDGRKRNVFCKTDGGQLYSGQVWPGRTVFPDFPRAEARAWWSDLNVRHVRDGVAGIWIDMNEPATGTIEPFAMRFDRDGANHPHERYHNQYALLMALATFEGLCRANPGARPFILSRAGFAGIQRYAAQWLGDNVSDWEHLRLSVPMAMGLGISGQPFVGADIPGFSASPTPELAVRWIQYGALTPFCRCHNELGERDQYPWSFGPGVEKRFRAALELRYRLLPYIYSSFVMASESGDPIQRPLVYDFQHDPHARETDDAYLLGDALLVAPVLGPGQTARHVYLPQGTWVDWHTGESHAGGQFITASAPLDRIPVFARGGRVIPAWEVVPASTMDHYPESLELHVFVPAEDGESVSYVHEDDGVSDAYSRGAFLRTAVSVIRDGDRIRVRSTVSGKGFPEFRRRSLRLVFHGAPADVYEVRGGELLVLRADVVIENRGEPFERSFLLGRRRS